MFRYNNMIVFVVMRMEIISTPKIQLCLDVRAESQPQHFRGKGLVEFVYITYNFTFVILFRDNIILCVI